MPSRICSSVLAPVCLVEADRLEILVWWIYYSSKAMIEPRPKKIGDFANDSMPVTRDYYRYSDCSSP